MRREAQRCRFFSTIRLSPFPVSDRSRSNADCETNVYIGPPHYLTA
jgi:hypothetical protein